MKNLILTCTLLLLSTLAYCQDKLPAYDPAQKNSILVSAGDVNTFLRENFNAEAGFSEMKVESKGGDYYLLALDAQNEKTYAFKLKMADKKYMLSKDMTVHACACNCMDLKSFTFEKAEMTGCEGTNHTIISGGK